MSQIIVCQNCSHDTIKMPDGTVLHHSGTPTPLKITPNWKDIGIKEIHKAYSGKLCMENDCQCLRPE